MSWRMLVVGVVLSGCELMEPAPHDTGPRYVTVFPSSGASSGETGGSGVSAETSSSTSRARSSSSGHVPASGAACPEWCSTARGYHCEDGECVLNGSGGPIQVTLDWSANNPRAREDLDLHLVDPSGCEIYYGSRSCGSGSLDLDQNASCSQTDNQGGVGNDIENIIYEAGSTPQSGHYTVWVVDWEDSCDGNQPNPFSYKVTVRYHGQSHVYSGQFFQGSGNMTGAVNGMPQNGGQVIVTSFDY